MIPVDHDPPLPRKPAYCCAGAVMPSCDPSRRRHTAAILIWINQGDLSRAYKRQMHIPLGQKYCRLIRNAGESRGNTGLAA